jgi:protease IV
MPDPFEPPPPPPESRPPLTVVPMSRPLPPPPPPAGVSVFRVFFWFLFLASVALNCFLFLALVGQSFGVGDGLSSMHLEEKYHAGHRDSKNKIAIVRVDGAIMEGMLHYVHKEIERAASDNNVKAVVVRINSPGGSITASDDLYQRLVHLRDGTTPGHLSSKKPLIVSMASLTASGGYYIAMAAERLLAERTTITGSIGVYAAFPNVSKLTDKYGFDMIVIKSDDLKDSGSPFKPMRPQEHQLWQDMVNHAFQQFIEVVEEGRPQLKGKLTQVVEEREIPDGNEKVKYVRKRADGGIFTANKALEYGLVDQIGDVDDAVAEASKAAALGDDYRSITYQKPISLFDLFGGQTKAKAPDFGKLAELAMPRLWYLAPQSDLAGYLAALGRE